MWLKMELTINTKSAIEGLGSLPEQFGQEGPAYTQNSNRQHSSELQMCLCVCVCGCLCFNAEEHEDLLLYVSDILSMQIDGINEVLPAHPHNHTHTL